MSEFNEPWSVEKMSNVDIAIIEKSDGVDVGYDFTHADADRIIACVNAMRDIEDPETWVERAKVALADPCHNPELMALAQEIEDGKPYRKPTPEEHTMIVKQFVEEGLAIDRGFRAGRIRETVTPEQPAPERWECGKPRQYCSANNDGKCTSDFVGDCGHSRRAI